MEIAKEGDKIEWTIPEDSASVFAGGTYQAEVVFVGKDSYGVYAEYGQDYVLFTQAKIIRRNADK